MTRTNSKALEKLEKLGFHYNQKAQNIIKLCDDWYSNSRTEFHSRSNINGLPRIIDSINFAKRCCADDANLCEIVEINTGEKSFEAINDILRANRLDVMYRKQLERLSADGTVGCYIRIVDANEQDGNLEGGNIQINYCEAQNIIPLTVDNDRITECAFIGENIVKGKDEVTLVIFSLDEAKRYVADTYVFLDDKEMLNSSVQLGEVQPFAIMRSAEVNNIDDMEGYGYPKLYSSIPILKALDLAYCILFGDLDKGEKIVFINELLSCVATDHDGNKFLTKQQKELFVLLGEKLPTQDTIIQEYNPKLRIEEVTKIFETLLSLLSMSFGYGTKKYTFENGQIKTATEYIGSRQDCLQELNKQRQEAKAYITSICQAVAWFSNTFKHTNFGQNLEINIDFDDSLITDKESELERLRNDAITFDIPTLKVWYFMEAYNLDEEEATKMVEGDAEEKEKEDLEDANQGEDE